MSENGIKSLGISLRGSNWSVTVDRRCLIYTIVPTNEIAVRGKLKLGQVTLNIMGLVRQLGTVVNFKIALCW